MNVLDFLVMIASVQTNILNKFYGLLLRQYFYRILIRKGIVIIVSYPAYWRSLMITANAVNVPHSIIQW